MVTSHKPEVDSNQPLDAKHKGGTAFLPHLKSVGIPPKFLWDLERLKED